MMNAHFTYLTPFFENPDHQALVTAAVIGGGLVFWGARSATALKRRRNSLGVTEGVIPEKKVTSYGLFDFFIESFVHFQDSVLGKENRKYLPLTGTVFLYTLIVNLLGLIPGIPAVTGSVAATLPIALLIFISFNAAGIKEHGLKKYLAHFAGPVWWLIPLIMPLELIGTCLRVLTLNLRLLWNIRADHLVLGIFTDLVPFAVPVVFLTLGTFVCFMQAFVPTVLTMIYIMLATQHEEGEHH